MALIVSEDRQGPWAAVECDRAGCEHHVSVRPVAADWSRYEMACTVFDMAEEDGWAMQGSTYCPEHRPGRLERRVRLADGFSWARTAVEGVKSGPGPA